MKSAVVTGATGFIGVHLVKELLSHGVEVTAFCRENSLNLDRLPSGIRVVSHFQDLTQADVFYHLAWEGASGSKRSDPRLQLQNVDLTLNALASSHAVGCKKFIALGTVYENLSQQIRNSNSYSRSDFYILSKANAHDMSNQMAYQLEIPYVWCTICHPIGKYIKPDQLMSYVISNMLNGNPTSFGPAATPYDILAVENVAYGLYLVGEHETRRRHYYIGSGKPERLSDYLYETHRILGSDMLPGIGQREDDGYLFDKNWFDIAPIEKDIGYRPIVDFEGAVRNTTEWIKNT